MTLKSETKLVGAWWKPGFDYPARMASDGLVSETTITLTLRGLVPGKHSLATVHNSLGDAKLGLHTIRIGEAAVNVEPSHRVKHDTDAARSFLEFEAAGDVVVTISAVGPVVLNGIEIDRQDPAKRADMPSPSNQDFHTIENPMLTWRASPTSGAASCLSR